MWQFNVQRSRQVLGLIGGLLLSLPASADSVKVEHVQFTMTGANVWQVSATLRHSDTGWKHYADAWRVVAAQGKVFGARTLFHPHENEQPFTRNLGGVKIPAGKTIVFVEAHDKVHGWSDDRVRVALDSAKGERFTVKR